MHLSSARLLSKANSSALSTYLIARIEVFEVFLAAIVSSNRSWPWHGTLLGSAMRYLKRNQALHTNRGGTHISSSSFSLGTDSFKCIVLPAECWPCEPDAGYHHSRMPGILAMQGKFGRGWGFIQRCPLLSACRFSLDAQMPRHAVKEAGSSWSGAKAHLFLPRNFDCIFLPSNVQLKLSQILLC